MCTFRPEKVNSGGGHDFQSSHSNSRTHPGALPRSDQQVPDAVCRGRASFGAPLAARLTTLIDQRIVIAFGFSLFALSCWLMSGITDNWGFWQLFLPQAVRGFAMLLCIVPAVGMALNGVPPSDLRYASGLFNLMRNMGGAVGIAIATTLLQDFGRLHGERFGEAMDHGHQAMLSAGRPRARRSCANASRPALAAV